MSGVNEADRAAQDKLKQLERDIDEMRRYPDLPARKKAAIPANATLKEVRAAINQLRKAVNATEDVAQKGVFKKRLDEYTKKMDGLKIDIAGLVKALPKGMRTADDRDAEAIFGKDGADLNDAGQVMTAVNKAQDNNLQILAEVEREAYIIRDTGDAIVNQLALDDEKIAELDKDMNTLQANLTAAKGEVEWFARQMATDKCFMMLLLALLLGLGGLVFYKIYSGRKSSSSSKPATTVAPAATPAPPPPTTAAPPVTTAVPTTTRAAVAYVVHAAIQFALSD